MVEILIAVSIMLMIAISTISVVQRGLSISEESLSSTQASFLLEEGGEVVRIIRDKSWNTIAGLSTSTDYYPTFSADTWTLSATPNTIDSFTRKVTIATVNRDATSGDIVSNGGVLDTGTYLVNVNVSWQENGKSFSKNLPFYISNIFQ